MKDFLIVICLALLSLVSCDKKNDAPIVPCDLSVSTSNVYLGTRGETDVVKIKATGLWGAGSMDTDIAHVDNLKDGIRITSGQAGTTRIEVVCGSSSKIITVHVTEYP